MKQIIPAMVCVGLAALVSGAAFGQSEAAPKFEIADIHTSERGSAANPQMRNGFYRGGRYEIRSGTMVDLISLAYGVDGDKVLSGPAWLETDRYDVIATAPANSTRESLRTMLQTLLAERFSLKLHIDKKEFPTFALTAGKQPKLKEGGSSAEVGCNFDVQGGNNGGGRGGDGAPPTQPTLSFKCSNMSMAALAEYMHSMPAGSQFLGTNPLVDETGLEGVWNFEFHFTLPNGQPGGGANVLFDAFDKQLGLKLEARKVPLPVIIVDSANEKPTPNLPGITEKLPVAPTEFEVADIKPSDPNGSSQNRNPFLPGGRLDLRGGTLKDMIGAAWTITPDKIVGGPKFLDVDKYDIVAKAPAMATSALTSSNQNNQPPVDIDAIRLMLRALLVDRFKLATHAEDRPADAYTLVALKPKMKKADPANRTGFKEGAGPDGKDPRKDTPALGRLVTCQNMTMAQFAEALPRIAGGYFQNVNNIVVDATGLEGAYDFTLSFSGAGILRNNGGGRGGDGGGPAPAAPGAAGEASDPGGGVTLFDAIEKQLGIKIEIQKRPMPVLVIDHIEQKPTNN